MMQTTEASIASSVGHFQEYLRNAVSTRKTLADFRGGLTPFITISRQAGAGGHTLSKAILREMEAHPSDENLRGWQILDQEICAKVLEDPRLKVPMESLMTEEFHSELEDYLRQMVVGTSAQVTIFHRIFKYVRALAMIGKVIVVGRAASLLTEDLPGGIHLRLVAPMDLRIKNMMGLFNLTRERAEEEIHEQDAARALLVRNYFHKNIEDPLLYDSVWNTGKVPIPMIAKAVVRMVEVKSQVYYSEHK